MYRRIIPQHAPSSHCSWVLAPPAGCLEIVFLIGHPYPVPHCSARPLQTESIISIVGSNCSPKWAAVALGTWVALLYQEHSCLSYFISIWDTLITVGMLPPWLVHGLVWFWDGWKRSPTTYHPCQPSNLHQQCKTVHCLTRKFLTKV